MNTNPLSRRRFLQAGASVAAGLSVPLLAQVGNSQDKKADPAPAAGGPQIQHPSGTEYGGFMVGVQSYTFRQFNLEQTLQRTAALGLHFIEFYNVHIRPASTEAQLNAMRKQCFDYGITPLAFGVQTFTRNHDANRRLFDFGRNFGIRYFSADPDPDSFDSLDRCCSEYGIGIAIHPHGPQGGRMHRWYSADIINPALVNHHRLIGTCMDTGHLIRSARLGYELDPASEIRAMGARNFGVHLKDNDNARGDNANVVFGRGSLDLASVFQAMRQVNFNGYVSIEYEAEANNPSPSVAACLEVMRNVLRTLPATAAPATTAPAPATGT